MAINTSSTTLVECDECGEPVDLTAGDVYMEGVLIGAECSCGYWQSEYTEEFRETADWLA